MLSGVFIWILSAIIITLFTQFFFSDQTYTEAVLSSVAGIIGMIPDGLLLLTSSVMAVSVVRLSKYKVLVQQLYCIETLARVDVICLDKTGTITEGTMELSKVSWDSS